MAATMGFAKANVTVTLPGETVPVDYTGVGILVRSGRARLTGPGGALTRERGDVAAAQRLNANRWSVTFADGEVWTVDRDKAGCGCSGSR